MLVKITRSYSLQRIAIAALSFGAILIAARQLPAEPYAVIMQALFLGKFLQISNLGLVNGYFVSRYSRKVSIAYETPSHDARFVTALLVQFLCVGGGIAILAWIYAPTYFPGALAFVILAPFYASEPVFRDRRLFFVSLFPDLTMAMALLAVALTVQTSEHAPVFFVVGMAMLAGPIWWALFAKLARMQAALPAVPLSWSVLAVLWRVGWPVYLGTALFMLASSADRLLLPLHGTSSDVARYFLAFQLAIGAMIFVSSINFTNVVDLGHANLKDNAPNRSVLIAKLLHVCMISVCSIGFLVAALLILEYRILDRNIYRGLTPISLALATGLGMFFIAGSVTPLLAYRNKQMPMTITMAGLAFLILGNNILALKFGFGPLWLACGTAFGFTVYGLVAILYTLRVISQTPDS